MAPATRRPDRGDDLTLAAHRMLGDQDEQIERARRAVVEILDAAAAAGVGQDELDAFVRKLRTDQCDVVSVIAAAAWVAGERARAFGSALPGPAWATVDEIAAERGAPVDVVDELVRDALRRGLLAREPGRGVRVTATGQEHSAKETAL